MGKLILMTGVFLLTNTRENHEFWVIFHEFWSFFMNFGQNPQKTRKIAKTSGNFKAVSLRPETIPRGLPGGYPEMS